MHGDILQPDTESHQGSLIRRFMYLFAPAAAVILLSAYYVHHMQVEEKRHALMQQEQLRLAHQVRIIHQTFDAVFADLIILSKHNDFNHIPTATPATIDGHLDELAQEFRQFHIYKPHYDQVRFIDKQGMELIRTNRIGDVVNIVEKSDLQRKKHKNYFTHAISLGKHEVYISPLELNTEHGVVQLPPNPTIRFALPIFGDGDESFGVLALNYRAGFLLQQLRHAADKSHLILLNSLGYWLQDDDPSRAWGFMYPDGENRMFKQSYPQIWASMRGHDSGQLLLPDGLFTFTKVHPLSSIINRKHNNIPSRLLYKAEPEDYTWILLLHIRPEQLSAMTRISSLNYLAIIVLLLIWAAIVGLIVREQKIKALTHSRLQAKETEIRNIVDSAFNGIISINEQGIIETFNPAASRMFGYSQEEAVGKNISLIVASPHDSQHDGYIARFIRTREKHVVDRPREVVARHQDGTNFPVELFVTARQQEGRWVFVGILHDISKRKAMEAKLTMLATTDGLTGLHNRAYFNEHLGKEYKRARRYQSCKLSLLIMDADYFKRVNDDYGHPAGDAVLIAIAKKARECAREYDVVARYGGEEFALILPETDAESAVMVAERLRESIESMQIAYEGLVISKTVSIGVACLQDPELTDEDDLLVQADKALYQAKEEGRNRVVLYQHTDS